MTQDSTVTSPALRRNSAARKAPRPVHPLLHKLFELYPRLFGARFLPLKIGVFEDLVAAHPTALPAAELKVALGLHTRSTRYIESVASGLARHDLQARPVEPVAPACAPCDSGTVQTPQRQAPEQARQHAVKQMAAAIEASGLSAKTTASASPRPTTSCIRSWKTPWLSWRKTSSPRSPAKRARGQRQADCRVRRDVWVGPDGSEKAAGVKHPVSA